MQIKGVKVRSVEFGAGIPKICVPVVGRSAEEILQQAKQAMEKGPDMLELRADWFEESEGASQMLPVLKRLRSQIGDTVLLFTFRSSREGGQRAVTVDAYRNLCETVCRSGDIDLLDVEGYMQEGLLGSLVETAHANGVSVVGSYHDFDGTPAEQEIVNRLQYLDRAGADFPKVAVMPREQRDVLTLLSATLGYYEMGGEKPVITMSMEQRGLISRLAGGSFGSCITFAAVDKASAPGQISIDQVREMLSVLYRQ